MARRAREVPHGETFVWALWEAMAMEEASGSYRTRLVVRPGSSRGRLLVRVDIVECSGERPRVVVTTAREWPHGDARTLDAALFQQFTKAEVMLDEYKRQGGLAAD